MIWDDERFKNFPKRRQPIIERLTETRKQLDDWLETNEAMGNIADLAYLEGLLQVRRELLSKLAALDEEMIELLIEVRTSAGPQ